MKTYKLTGKVDRLKKEDVTRREKGSVGENKITRTVETEQYTAVVIGSDGERVRLTKDTAFDLTVGEDVTVQIGYGIQTHLPDEDDKKPKKK